jgi:hypothetical protein
MRIPSLAGVDSAVTVVVQHHAGRDPELAGI